MPSELKESEDEDLEELLETISKATPEIEVDEEDLDDAPPPPPQKPRRPDAIMTVKPAVSEPVMNAPIQIIRSKPDDGPSAPIDVKESSQVAGIKGLLDIYVSQVSVLINNQVKDREQIDQAFNFLDGAIRTAAESGLKISPVYVESWAKLAIAKAEVNQSSTAVLDSIAKLLAAGKKNELVVNTGSQTAGTSSIDLADLLSQDIEE